MFFAIFVLNFVIFVHGNPVLRSGCAPYPKDCKMECVSIAADGCIVCQCPSSNSGSGSGSVSAGAQTSVLTGSHQTGTGCPAYPKDCSNAAIDSNTGCVICLGSGPGQSNTGTGSGMNGGGISTGSGGQSQTGTGCPTFPKGCPMACVSIDTMGCVLCKCSNNTQGTGASSNTGNTNLVNGPGCAPFDEGSCQKSCVKRDNDHCLVCDCSTGTSTGGSKGSGGCPPFDVSNCDMSCVGMDSMGCLSCNCPATTTAASPGGTTQAPSSGGGQGAGGCPPFDVSTCDMDCVGMDANGCLSCNCPASTAAPAGGTTQTPSSGGGQGAGGCPPFDVSICDMDCVSMDANGCLSCNCPASTASPGTTNSSSSGNQTSGGQGAGGCPPFDASVCDLNCVSMESSGCLSCNCPPSTVAPSGGTTQAPSSGGGQGAGGCPPFDVSTCDMDCVSMDANGCLSCSCPASTVAPTGSTAATTVGNGSGGGQSAGGCPPFDVSTCDMSCVVMDSSGCLSCSCPLTTVSSGSNTTVVTGTTQSPQGAGGCPAFDASTCDMSCVAMDSNGCLSCHCPDTTVGSVTTTAAASGTTASSGNGQGAGGCPAFDVSTCDMNCVSMDSNGCLGCNCPATTVGSVTTTAAASGTTASSGGGQGAGGCPAFDVSSCDMNCVSMDSNGCLGCNCPATTSTPASTAAPSGTTNAPSGGNGNNGGCPAFDANQCDIKCTKMDVNGCLHCECPVSNNSTVNTFGPGTLGGGTGGTSGNNGGCSAISPGCDISCLQINSNGCVICSCKSTSIKPLVLTTKAPVRPLPTTRAPVTTKAILTTKVPIATTDSNVCPPIRCVAPCNVGITFGPDNCPICKCKN
ncbi:mucin-5AC-like [Mytilus californianus]|uniref:mucin-5AC-like n=1 Tax=Mytilus californianus TaxID=6549 RepID=UPI00224526C9|nr:mucin-5AC-like [Mytilus californianus]